MRYLLILLFLISFSLVNGQITNRFGEEDSTDVSVPEGNLDSESSNTEAKKKRPSPSKFDKFRFGGMFGASLGSVISVEISPRVHYLLTEQIAVGGGVTYNYFKDNRDYGPFLAPSKREFNIYGASAFAWFNPISVLLIHTEFEALNFDVYNAQEQTYGREWVPGLLLGGGIRQQSGRANLFAVLLYNVLYNENKSVYSSPYVLRIGVGF